MVLLVGVFAVVLAAMTVVVLPAYDRVRAVTDGETLWVIAQRTSLPKMPDSFLLARTDDGSTFVGAPKIRAGKLRSITADNGALYMHFQKGSVHRLRDGEPATVRSAAPWPLP